MFQRESVRQALERRRALRGNSPQFQKAAQFIEDALDSPDDCWESLAREFRRNYSDVMDEIVGVLMETDDPLIVYNMLRIADLSDPEEAEAARKIVRDLDPERHGASLLAMTDEPSMHATIRRKQNLPASVHRALNPEEPAAAPQETKPKRPRPRRPRKKSTEAEPAS
jgi:hypothetical protein